jgi:hypothetical protein
MGIKEKKSMQHKTFFYIILLLVLVSFCLKSIKKNFGYYFQMISLDLSF